MARIILILIGSIVFYSCSTEENKKKDKWVELIQNDLEIKILGFKSYSGNIKSIIDFNGSIDTSYFNGGVSDIIVSEELIIPSMYKIEKSQNKIHFNFIEADRSLQSIVLIMNNSEPPIPKLIRLQYKKHYWLYKSNKIIEFIGQDVIKIRGSNKSLFQHEQQFSIQYIKL
jgi:hypothetical protein